MQLSQRRLGMGVIAAGYVGFVACALLLFSWLTRNAGMDVLLAFLLSQVAGMLILYYMRRALCHIWSVTFRTREYGVFLLINGAALAVNAFIMYMMDSTSAIGAFPLNVYATIVSTCANVVLFVVQLRAQSVHDEKNR